MKSDYLGGVVMFVIMFAIAIVEIYILKDVQAFQGKGKKGKKGGKGGKKGGKGKKGGGKKSSGTPSSKPAASKPAASAPAAGAGCNCSCMPMDSDPSRQKIETPDGVDCANHEYPGSVEECETLLATVANSPCCCGGGGGGD